MEAQQTKLSAIYTCEWKKKRIRVAKDGKVRIFNVLILTDGKKVLGCLYRLKGGIFGMEEVLGTFKSETMKAKFSSVKLAILRTSLEHVEYASIKLESATMVVLNTFFRSLKDFLYNDRNRTSRSIRISFKSVYCDKISDMKSLILLLRSTGW